MKNISASNSSQAALPMEFRVARMEDVEAYVSLATAAQCWLRDRGLRQFVPAAHHGYTAAIRARVEARSLYTVWCGNVAVAFFNLERGQSSWWPLDDVQAMYLTGMVVSIEWRGQGVGRDIIRWCVGEAIRQKCHAVRLDCHADNTWLCQYYEAQGFELQGQVEQHSGYVGCLYQRTVALAECTGVLGE